MLGKEGKERGRALQAPVVALIARRSLRRRGVMSGCVNMSLI